MVKWSNTTRNGEQIIDLLGLEGAMYFGGGCNDNEAATQCEIVDAFDYLMGKGKDSPIEEVQGLAMVNGVKRRPIPCDDPYHWSNLANMHASKAFAGNTVNGEHEQCHYRQAMMSTHSLHSDNASYS